MLKPSLFKWTQSRMVSVTDTLYCSTEPLFILFTAIQQLQKEYFNAGYNAGIEHKRSYYAIAKQSIIDRNEERISERDDQINSLQLDLARLMYDIDNYRNQIRQLTNEVCDLRENSTPIAKYTP